MTEEAIDIQPETAPKKRRGGARPGAGRKPLYNDTLFTTRLKCRFEITDKIRACITIFNNLSKRRLSDIFATKLNGEKVVEKGAKCKRWTDADALSTPWSITVNESYDERLFVLAFIIEKPRYVRIDWLLHNGTVQLRWQRLEEIGRIMMTYGSLIARKNRLRSSEQELLDEIPHFHDEIYTYLEDKLSSSNRPIK